jgi:hypothetical protein
MKAFTIYDLRFTSAWRFREKIVEGSLLNSLPFPDQIPVQALVNVNAFKPVVRR